MKVKVAYTIDFDDVPELMETLLSSIKQSLSDCSQRLKFKPNDLARMAEEFQEARIKLEIIDNQIQDIMQITIGWLDAGEPVDESDLISESKLETSEELNEEPN